MRVLSVIHGPDRSVGALRRRDPRRRGTSSSSGRSAAGPQPGGDFDAVLVLGGAPERRRGGGAPVARGRVRAAPRPRRRARRRCSAICLGAQTLAHAFGGRVAPLGRQQAGFERGLADRRGPRRPGARRAPGALRRARRERLRLRAARTSAVLLADSAIQPQAFRIGERAWAVQFHPEARRDQVLDWFADDARRLCRGRSPSSSASSTRRSASWHRLGTRALPGLPRAGTGFSLPVTEPSRERLGTGTRPGRRSRGDFPITCSPPRCP